MKKKNLQIVGDRRGQGLVEYLILVALVAVAAISVVSVVGHNVREQYGRVSDSLNNKRTSVRATPHTEHDLQKRGLHDFNDAAVIGQ